MRVVRSIIIVLSLGVLLLLEREYPLVPFTWIILGFVSLRVKLSGLLMVGCTLLADFALALPLGSSAVICAIFMTSVSFAPKKTLWRTFFFALAGALLGVLYGTLRQSLTVELFFFSSLFCTILYSFGSTLSTIEEIGHVQE